LDYSKNLIDKAVMEQLVSLAHDAGVPRAIEELFRGGNVNFTENRPALHAALRDQSDSGLAEDPQIHQLVNDAKAKMYAFADQLMMGELKGFTGDVINEVVVLGIGGSYLGPRLCCEALRDYKHTSRVKVRFVATLDPAELLDVLERANVERVLFIISSKSFTTLETLKNSHAAKQWLVDAGCAEADLDKHFAAITASEEKALALGVRSDFIFPIWDWVGGRYSLWSCIGLPILLRVGKENFEALLEGAYEMDTHFRTAPFEKNMPVIMALLGVWYRNYFESSAIAVVPYNYRLRSLTEHLQQVDMESNGKAVTQDGWRVGYGTGPVVLGGMGNNGQHAYYQLLHQGTELISVDFILTLTNNQNINGHHKHLFACGVGQSQALMQGRGLNQVREEFDGHQLYSKEGDIAEHYVIPGEQPSNSLVLDKLTPKTLGALLALYEHKVFCQGVIWNVNSFDQWGVELGKELATTVEAALSANNLSDVQLDMSTRNLIKKFLVLN
jgi:glucose-6-phosphate isomerase